MKNIGAYLYKIKKFLCLNLWLGEVCTYDANTDANDDDTNNDDEQSMIV